MALLLFVMACMNIHWAGEHFWVAIDGMDRASTAGHMSAVTAFCFVLVSLSFLTLLVSGLNHSWLGIFGLVCAAFITGICLVFLLAYLFGTPLLYGGRFIPPALNTLLAIALLSIALLILILNPPAYRARRFLEVSEIVIILLLVFAFLAAGIITTGYLSYRQYEQKFRGGVNQQIESIVELKANELTQWRKERLKDGAHLFGNPVFSSLVRRFFENPKDTEVSRGLEVWMSNHVSEVGYYQLVLFDTQGVNRLTVPSNRTTVDPFVAQHIPELLSARCVMFRDFYRNEYDQRVYLDVLVPIFDAADTNRSLGLLVMRIDPEVYLYPFISRWPTLSVSAETLLVRREGSEVVFLNKLRFDTNTALNLREPIDRPALPAAQAARGVEGIMDGIDYRGVPVVAALRTIPDSPWSLVARMDSAEVYTPIRERLWQVVVMVGALILCAGAFVSLIWRRQRLLFYKEQVSSVDSVREAKEYLENLITHANAPIIVWDPQFHITRFNEAFESLTGRKAVDVVGGPLEILFPPAQVANSMELIRKTLGGERWESVEISIQHCDGSLRTVLWNSATIYAADGKTPMAAIAQGHDITKRKRAEQYLMESESKYHSLIDNMTEGVALHEIICDQNGKAVNYRIVDVNPAFEKQTGIAVTEALGRLATELYHVDTAPFLDIYDRVVRTGTPCTFETENPVLNKKFTISVYSPKPGWFATIFTDITQRLKLNEANARLATAVEQAAETVVITDADGAILYANPAFEKTTGYTLTEALGQNPRILKSGKHDAEFYRHMWEVLNAGKVWTGRITNKRKDGTIYEEDASLSPVLDAAGKIVNFVGVKRDITRESQLEQQILQAQKMEAIGRLAGGVAHDFNNILAVVLMNASELSDDANATPAQTEGLNEIIQAAERGANLTRQMLTFSRRQVMQMRTLDLNDVVVGVTKMLQRIIGEDIVLQTRLAPDDMLVWGDSGMIEQVLLNLAVNARDAMPEGGHLTMELGNCVVDELSAKAHKGKAGDFVLLTVRDDGFGISQEHLSHIFEPFYTTKAAGKGTGLGLATLHGIVEQHHGWVVVESEVGQGTAFFIYFPRLLMTKQVGDEPAALVSVNGGTETILVVEDEKSLRTLAVRILKHSGYHVLEASDGAEALKVWREHHLEVDLLVTDIIMPGGISGGKLADQLRAEKPGLKVIYMSGYSGEVAGTGLNLREGRQFLQKPFPPSKLVQTVREYLDAV